MGARLFRIDDERYSVCKRAGRGNATNGLRLLIDIIRDNFDVDTLKPKQEISPAKQPIRVKKQPLKNEEPITRALEQKYKELYCATYKVDPIISVKQRSIFKRIIQNIGKDKSIILVELYFKSEDEFYSKRKHPVEFMERDANILFAESADINDLKLEEVFNYISEKTATVKAWWDK